MRFPILLPPLALLVGSLLTVVPLPAQDTPERRLTFEVDSVEVALELRGPAVVALADEIRTIAEGSFAYDLDLFGSLPREFRGGPYERITIAIAEGDDLHGESDPGRIDMTMPPPEEPLDHLFWKAVLTHEIFHLWNAEGFRYASVEEQWLSEGFSQYYMMRALGRMGVLDETAFLQLLSQFLGLYLSDPGLGSMSIREAGPVKQEHVGLVEGGGVAVGFCLDVDLRVASSGERSLDDVMRLLFAHHDASDRRYGLGDVARYVGEVRGEDRSAFFRDYVAGTATLPLAECLAPVGLALSFEDGGAHVDKDLGFGEPQARLLAALRGL